MEENITSIQCSFNSKHCMGEARWRWTFLDGSWPRALRRPLGVGQSDCSILQSDILRVAAVRFGQASGQLRHWKQWAPCYWALTRSNRFFVYREILELSFEQVFLPRDSFSQEFLIDGFGSILLVDISERQRLKRYLWKMIGNSCNQNMFQCLAPFPRHFQLAAVHFVYRGDFSPLSRELQPFLESWPFMHSQRLLKSTVGTMQRVSANEIFIRPAAEISAGFSANAFAF